MNDKRGDIKEDLFEKVQEKELERETKTKEKKSNTKAVGVNSTVYSITHAGAAAMKTTAASSARRSAMADRQGKKKEMR